MENQGKPILQIEVPIAKAKRLTGLKNSSYKDYIGARVLFLNNQLHQAAILANTCIEKELKACLYTLGSDSNIQHDSFKLLNMLREKEQNVYNKLNPDFIKVLGKIYKSRYHEKLNPGYNFVIIKRKFLAELDYTYSILEGRVRFRVKSEQSVMPKTLYEIDVQNQNSLVFTENYLLNKVPKSDFLNQPDEVYEFRMIFNHEVMEAAYTIPRNIDFSTFLYEGLAPTSNDNQGMKISNLQPGINKINLFRNGILQTLNIT